MVVFGLLALGVARAASKMWVQSFEASPALYIPMVDPAKVPKEFQHFLETPTLRGTLRFRLAISIGGEQIRVRFSNELGDSPINIMGASVAVAMGQIDANPSSIQRLTFGGKVSVVAQPGAPVLSDPIKLELPDFAELVVTIYVPDGIKGAPMGGATIEQVADEAIMNPTLPGATTFTSRPFVAGVLVLRKRPTRVIVAFGDSITDAVRPKPAEPHGWADALARRLRKENHGSPTAVVSAGIGGNRILSPGMGEAALSRFDRDVLAVAGLSHIIVLEGINDIGMSGDSEMFGHQRSVDQDELISGLTQIAQRAHVAGVKIYAGTILPFRGAQYFSEEKEKTRLAVNAWLMKSPLFDGVIDFAQATRSPASEDSLNPQFDSGDHLHPSEAGYQAMANAIRLKLFN